MARLFLTLFIPVFLVIILFVFAVDVLPEILLKNTAQQAARESFEGTISLLDERISEVESAQLESELKKLQKNFEYEINLVKLGDLDLKQHERRDLMSGKFVIFENDKADYFYVLSSLNQYAWKLQVEQTETEDYRRLAAGTRHLLEMRFSGIPENKWNQEVRTLNNIFGFPISLMKSNETELKDEALKQLKAGETVALDYDEHNERYYFRLLNSDYVLKAGPLHDPAVIRFLPYVLLAMLAFMIGLAVWLWLRPVWRDLRGLNDAAEDFGESNLNTRIKFHKRSPIKMIVKSFNDMAARVEQLISSHEELTNAVSHELRTPVSRLRFSLDMMEKTSDESDRNRYIQEMNTDIEELDELLGELLSYARVDRLQTEIKFVPVMVQEWFDIQVERWARQQKDISVEGITDALPQSAVLCMEPKLMARALGNLLQNACRYAKGNVYAHLSQNTDYFQLSVDDDGPGIPEEYRGKVFDAFTRVDVSRDRQSGGFGLGLAIVSRIAEWHGGDVQVMQSSLGGARFVLRWPISS
ncbi:MAG TPA: HAMP domain-containing protein [Chromatiales bacterium]|nr:HAMP domain-containing protein [Thiotrichales bacterium]HIP67077.1 HAMP domain-containing protein [Chromatiales bacterium]